MQIEDALDRFVRQLRADGRSPHTIDQYRRHVLVLARWAAQEGLSGEAEEIDHETLARFLASPDALTAPDGRPKKPGSVNALRSSMKGFFRYLHRAGHLRVDPSRLVRRAMCGTSRPQEIPESDQGRLLAALAVGRGAAAERDHALFRFLLLTGTRVTAALALDVEDLDLERGEALLRECKGGRVERIFLPPGVQEHLRTYLVGRTSGPVFRRQDGGRITSRHAHRRLGFWLKKADCRPASPHALRRSFAMALYRRTRDVLLVQRALGHRSIGSTLRYARVEDERLREAIQTGF